MSNSTTWTVVDKYGREIQRYSGPLAGMQARDFARMIKGTAHCLG